MTALECAQYIVVKMIKYVQEVKIGMIAIWEISVIQKTVSNFNNLYTNFLLSLLHIIYFLSVQHSALFIVVEMICIVLVLGIMLLANNLVLIIVWPERMANAGMHVQFNVERMIKFALDLLMTMVAKLWLTFAITWTVRININYSMKKILLFFFQFNSSILSCSLWARRIALCKSLD